MANKTVRIHEDVVPMGKPLLLADTDKVLQVERFSRRTPEDQVEWVWRVIYITESKA